MSPTLSRREAIRQALLGTAGLLFADRLTMPAWGELPAPTGGGRARSVIQIWLWGGAGHLDTFDPKPAAGSDYSGPFQAIDTVVPGVRLCELLPELAKQAKRYSLVRSLTHTSNAHETATYLVQTGRQPGGRTVYPGVGATIAWLKGQVGDYHGPLPPYVVLTEPLGRFGEAGFLGARARPFATGGDPSQPRFAVEGIVAEGVTDQQQRDRRELLRRLDRLPGTLPDNATLKAFVRAGEQAYDMILGDGARVFDLAAEPDALRQRYGRNKFGQSCLMARRLVEQGVPYVTINYGGWDTHKDNFTALRRKLPELDAGLATLLDDLAQRGLLDRTVVWCGGEFGRTPKVDWGAPWNGGRGHWGAAFSALLAGGGFQGGRVVGATDARGEAVAERPVAPIDLIGSLYHVLGVDPAAALPHPDGLDVRVLPTAAEGVRSHGLLKELW